MQICAEWLELTFQTLFRHLEIIKECKQMYIFITKKGTFYCTQIKTGMKQNIKNILNMENNP